MNKSGVAEERDSVHACKLLELGFDEVVYVSAGVTGLVCGADRSCLVGDV